MKVVSVFNYKGGVGKTTLTANLGAQLARMGKKVLLIDFDPQASLTFSFIRPDEWDERYEKDGTIKSWFDSFENGNPRSLQSLIHQPAAVNRLLAPKSRLDVIYSHFDLIAVDRELAIEMAGITQSQREYSYFTVHRRLSAAIMTDLADADYDIVLIDCPPNLNTATEMALIASNFFLIPVLADDLAVLGLNHLFRNIGKLVQTYNHCASNHSTSLDSMVTPRPAGTVFTMIEEFGAQPIAVQRQFIAQTRQLPEANVFSSYIKRNNVLFSQATQFGIPVVLTNPVSPAGRSVIEGLKYFSYEFLGAIGL